MGGLTSRQIIEKIFEYDDYRVFMKDYFAARKKERDSFSLRNFTLKAGFKAHNFCSLVVNGKRNLSVSSIQKLLRAAGLRGRAATFFENLVHFNQATSLQDKEFFFQKIKKAGKAADFYQVNADQYFFYETWYYPVIRELMAIAPWNGDFARLAQMVRPPIHPTEAKDAVERLLATGMVKAGQNGSYSLNHEFVSSKNVPPLIKAKGRRDVLLKGIETVDSIEPAEKYAAYATVTMSEKLYIEARVLLDEMRERLLAMVAEDTDPDEVYEVVLQMFPVSSMRKRSGAAVKGGAE